MISKFLPLAGLFLAATLWAQEPVTTVQPPSVPDDTPSALAPSMPVATPAAMDENAPADTGTAAAATSDENVPTAPAAEQATLAPSWETQKQARTFFLQIPAPRGQITDHAGKPLAQTRVSYNLSLNFPTSPPLDDPAVLSFADQQIQLARTMVDAPINVSQDEILKHYHNRAILPLDIATDLSPSDVETVRSRPLEHLSLSPEYQRFYPNGALAGHIIGYVGRSGRPSDAPVQNNDFIWPGSEGRDGLEQAFNTQLTGKNGQVNLAFDATGQKASEKIVIPPQPGANVVTTLDVDTQRLVEDVLSKMAKRGAIVIVDATNGDVVAMASTPCYNPNAFVPTISAEAYKALQDDPGIPMLSRAFRSSYPPGSTFKVPVGIAALESHAIKLGDEFDGPASIEIGGLVFHNWKKGDAGDLDFVGALTQSCDTWFYQVGMKTGAQPIIDWALKMGFGAKTGIPIGSEAPGRVPTEDYMKKVYGRKYLNGDIANLSIGQGDLLVTPLQMAEAMAAVGNGGTLYHARLVQQVQTYDSQIVTAYPIAIREDLGIEPDVMAAVKKGMEQVVSSPLGTAGKAAIDEVQIAGKTGTAQWGPKNKERDAAWFAGFVPADKPRYAFAVLYEGEVGQSTHGGTYCAPMIAKIMQQLFKKETKEKGAAAHHHARPAPTPAETND